MKDYKVQFYQDDIYEVLYIPTYESEFQGSLADCEAWIRLHEKGYMDY